MRKNYIDKSIVDEYYRYDPVTGVVKYKKRINGGSKDEGDIVGSINNRGYLASRINGQYTLLHRAIWVIMTGDQPDEIDHINGNRADNRWCNLRSVTRAENMKNKKRYKGSKYNGVTYRKDTGKWRARLRIDGVLVNIGQFDTEQEAFMARESHSLNSEFHKNHGRSS